MSGAARKLADPAKYHLQPTGFWKKFRDAVVVSPEISSGLPIQGVHRWPPPASRPERYTTPATKASDPAQNPYWKRDVRRAYPRLSVVTQGGLAELLMIKSSEGKAVAAPATDKDGNAQASVPAVTEAVELASVLAAVPAAFSASKLPPMLPSAYKRWVPERTEDAPHDPNAYFPMLLVK